MTTAPSSLPKVSADAHVNEPHDLWFDRLDERFRSRAPRRIQNNDDGTWSLVFDGSPLGWGDIPDEEAIRLESEREGAAAIDVRLEMMRSEAINAEVVYPSIGLYLWWNVDDAELGTACCRIYNDWLDERLGGHPRVGLSGLVPTWDVDHAIAEIERNAGRGFKAHMVPIHGTPPWNHRQWEPMWAAIAETGLPVVMHQATGHEQLFYRGWGSGLANLVTINTMAPRAAALLAASGVLERYEDLHVVLVEVNGGWLAATLQYMEEYQHARSSFQKPALAMLPSEYVRRQIHVTFQNDPLAVRNRDITGVDCLLWGNDYPHPEGTWPNSGKVLDELLRGVDLADAEAIVGRTAARLFGFSDEIMSTPA